MTSQSQKHFTTKDTKSTKENQYRVFWVDMWLAPYGFMGSDESRTHKVESAMVFKSISQAERRIERLMKLRPAESRHDFVIVPL